MNLLLSAPFYFLDGEMIMDNECCAKCRYMHRLKTNFKVGEGFEESHCCDVLLHLPKDESEGWVQEVTPQDRCEMYEVKL